ncbi:MAG: UDP-N-acetylmuramoyl-L-alanyl-D-glutamate--2,6-diaminopimelate ligase [Wenzhouxiangella sp.]|jgi:UDP-N-acetylmuramoyl-L-alanyl-D-glutamate--2,6-diaminopimelate ligase|nr:UDP-N-acetylmuramoyl-L-alanyl-D-glutamate--2,6-diaminopimelate ligase [Wenzhouxiangella sp.]
MDSDRHRSGDSVTLGWLLHDLGASEAPTDRVVDGLVLDSRQVTPGSVFVALAGAERHGLAFAEQAAAAGAVAIVHDGLGSLPDGCPVPLVKVPDLTRLLPELARRRWGDPSARMDLVAITGTNGKTSLAWLLAQALDAAMIGTLGVGAPGAHQALNHTTPDVLTLYRLLADLRHAGHTRVALEASSHALDQKRLEGLSFASVIFTTLGHDHLDYHADREAYAAAKARLFSDYPSRRQLINLDDSFGTELADRLADSQGLLTYGLESSRAQVSGELIEAGIDGLRGRIRLPGRTIEVRSDLIGRVNFYNLLVVAAELYARGRDPDEIATRLSGLSSVPGRMQRLCSEAKPVVVVDYAHTPDALAGALRSLRELCSGRLWCVFGCGGDRDRSKRPLMGQIAEALADQVILTDDNPRSEPPLVIIRDIQSGMKAPERSRVRTDRATAIALAIRDAADGDVVLIAGKGHEREQIVGDEVRPFCDAEEAVAALEARP